MIFGGNIESFDTIWLFSAFRAFLGILELILALFRAKIVFFLHIRHFLAFSGMVASNLIIFFISEIKNEKKMKKKIFFGGGFSQNGLFWEFFSIFSTFHQIYHPRHQIMNRNHRMLVLITNVDVNNWNLIGFGYWFWRSKAVQGPKIAFSGLKNHFWQN